MKLLNATEQMMEKEAKEGIVLLDFYTQWCGSCKMISTVLEQVKEEVSDEVTVLKVDAEELAEYSGEYDIMNVPTLILLNNGEEVKRINGFLPKQAMIEFLNVK